MRQQPATALGIYYIKTCILLDVSSIWVEFWGSLGPTSGTWWPVSDTFWVSRAPGTYSGELGSKNYPECSDQTLQTSTFRTFGGQFRFSVKHIFLNIFFTVIFGLFLGISGPRDISRSTGFEKLCRMLLQTSTFRPFRDRLRFFEKHIFLKKRRFSGQNDFRWSFRQFSHILCVP